jgi:glycosyltransferase involved in cell wall biosynthesis
MITNPLVSIVIPAYKELHFEKCLKSAISQTYKNIEIIVSDNCPSDTIELISKGFAGLVKYARNPVVGSDNVQTSLFMASGEIIKPLFDDDLLSPCCVSNMVNSFISNDDVSLVFSSSDIINENDIIIKNRRPFNNNQIIPSEAFKSLTLCRQHNFVGEFSSMAFKSSSIMNAKDRKLFSVYGYDASAGLADVAFFLNLINNGHAYYIDDTLSYFRKSDQHESNSNPIYNPNFILAITDWIELVIAAHQCGEISFAQLINAGENMHTSILPLHNRFPQILRSIDNFIGYCNEIQSRPE